MRHLELLGGRRADHLPDARDGRGVVGLERDPQRIGIGDHVPHAAPGHVDRDLAQFRHVDHCIQMRRERRHVVEADRDASSLLDSRLHLDQPGWRFQRQLGDRFAHRDAAGLDQRRDHADRVAAGHRGILRLLHDDETRIRLRVRRRHQHVAAKPRIAARLAQHAQTQVIQVRAEVQHLLEHRRARHVGHAVDDHAPGLAVGVNLQRSDGGCKWHACSSWRGDEPGGSISRVVAFDTRARAAVFNVPQAKDTDAPWPKPFT